MIVDDTMRTLRFRELRPGDVWMCPQSREYFMKVALTVGFNCVRLSDGGLYNRDDESAVDFYRSARLEVK